MTHHEFVRHYFTFDPDQTLPDGSIGTGQYVIVAGPKFVNHREILTQWMKGEDFSAEYTEDEWYGGVKERHFSGISPHTTLRVDELKIVPTFWPDKQDVK